MAVKGNIAKIFCVGFCANNAAKIMRECGRRPTRAYPNVAAIRPILSLKDFRRGFPYLRFFAPVVAPISNSARMPRAAKRGERSS